MIQRLIIFIKINILIRKKAFKRIELICQEYIRKYPNERLYHHYLAKIYKMQNAFEQAIHEYDFLTERNMAEIADYFDLIPLLFRVGNYVRVISTCEELLNKKKNRIEEMAIHPFLKDLHWYLETSRRAENPQDRF
jgi:tetratricopeptide (TPR) repeat protein